MIEPLVHVHEIRPRRGEGRPPKRAEAVVPARERTAPPPVVARGCRDHAEATTYAEAMGRWRRRSYWWLSTRDELGATFPETSCFIVHLDWSLPLDA